MPQANIPNETTEFPPKQDFCVSANIPVPPLDLGFFEVKALVMAGPVPFSFGK